MVQTNKGEAMKKLLLMLVPVIIVGCRTRDETTTTTVIDHVKNITTITETVKQEESFTLGSQGLGTYYLIHVQGL